MSEEKEAADFICVNKVHIALNSLKTLKYDGYTLSRPSLCYSSVNTLTLLKKFKV